MVGVASAFGAWASSSAADYSSVTGGILCAPPGKTITERDVALFIDKVRLQEPAS